jgi:putative transcriptional regulator
VHTTSLQELSDDAILGVLGQRVARHRLNRNKTQDEIAFDAGVSRRSVSKIENGHVVDIRILVRVLRALDLLDGLNALVSEPEVSPVALLEARGKERARASGSHNADDKSKVAEPGAWTWPDDNK